MTDTARETMVRVSEIFGPTIQGEGPLIGLPTVFVRTFGCDFRCSWCDSMHVVLPEYRKDSVQLTPREIVQRVLDLSQGLPILVTLSGGNPALQPLGDVITLGKKEKLTFAAETQGSIPARWMEELDYLILSPKPPSSGEQCNHDALYACMSKGLSGWPTVALKVVVFDDADLNFALDLHERYKGVRFYVQVGNSDVMPYVARSAAQTIHRHKMLDRLRWLSEKIIERRAFGVHVLPQLHTLMWGNERGR